MKTLTSLAIFLCGLATQTGQYPLPPDSQPQPGVPKGEVLKFNFEKSKVFPGTYRDYWVYVPAQYTPDRPACVYVNQDGAQWNAPVVFDNLIHKKEMPVTIGVFVMHGRVRAANPDRALDRFNRSYEYDGLGDDYARFLLEELLPDVETKRASDGRPLRLSKSGNDRAIGGASSGAICAFTAAWERPDAFSRVFSAIGTYVGLRGGDDYPTLIRKFEPKPIRVFLQDGSNDLNIYGGDWWMGNQMMERALTFSGYEVQHAWGDGGHNGQHGTAIFPDAMRFLWKDWPQPVKNGPTRNNTLNDILVPGEGWQLVGEGFGFTGALAANAKGEVYFENIVWGSLGLKPKEGTYRIGLDGKLNTVKSGKNLILTRAFGPDGRQYLTTAEWLDRNGLRVFALDEMARSAIVASDLGDVSDIIVTHTGNLIIADNDSPGDLTLNRILLVNPSGMKTVVYTMDEIEELALGRLTRLALSPDQTLLYVGVSRERWIYSFQIQPDGTLAHKQRYYWLHVPDSVRKHHLGDGMCVDRDGRLYVATELGIQVCDQAGRVNCILPLPEGHPADLCFGGSNFDTIFVTCCDKVYKRKLKVKGANAWAPPLKPAAPRL